MKAKEKLILTDVDGTILSWNDSFSKYMALKGHAENLYFQDKYSLDKRYGLDRNVMHGYIEDFNKSDYISCLPALADAEFYVKKLASLDFRFIAITSFGDDKDAYAKRLCNLKNIFGDVFDELICLPVGRDKYEALDRWYNRELFWIEDKFSNALIGHAAGLNAVLIDSDHNRDLITSRFPRVSSKTPWKEIYDLIIADYF